ncbi:MAG: site-2 protease family protein [Planctomycetota bacterium]|nr:site-2 protease family protein [Planctomycetota bacterium]
MNDYERPFDFSISLGSWFGTAIRVNLFFFLIIPAFCFALEDTTYGLVLGAVLFVSVLWHEFAHIVAARRTGGAGDRIMITPLGGMAYVQPGPSLAARILTPAAGPMVNLVICLILLPVVVHSSHALNAINPLHLPGPLRFQDQWLTDVLLVTFSVNWVLFLINLVPVYPLDGGQILKAILHSKTNAAPQIYIRTGTIIAWLVLIVGLVLSDPSSKFLVCFGAIILILNREESFRSRISETSDESFLGYDFSAGYTSLERSSPEELEDETDDESRQSGGPLQRWKERRLAEKLERDQQLELEAEQQLDAILEKLHANGMESLTESERSALENAANRYRDREKRTP